MESSSCGIATEHRRLNLGIALILVAAIYAPIFLKFLIKDTADGFWLLEVTVRSILSAFLKVYGGGLIPITAPLWFLLVGLAVRRWWKGRQYHWIAFFTLLWLAMAPLLILAGILVYPVFLARLLTWTIIPFSVLVGVGLSNLPRWRSATIGVVVILGGIAVSLSIGDSKTPWGEVMETVESGYQPGDAVLSCPGFAHRNIAHYWQGGDIEHLLAYDFPVGKLVRMEGSIHEPFGYIRGEEIPSGELLSEHYTRVWVVAWNSKGYPYSTCLGADYGEPTFSQSWLSGPNRLTAKFFAQRETVVQMYDFTEH